jgi:hypothetical protein
MAFRVASKMQWFSVWCTATTWGVIAFLLLSDSQRLNVAITCGKRHYAVICDTETATKSKFIGDVIDYGTA